MSIFGRVRPLRHLRRDAATWCGIAIHPGVDVLKRGAIALATDRICRRCAKAQAAAGRQQELPL